MDLIFIYLHQENVRINSLAVLPSHSGQFSQTTGIKLKTMDLAKSSATPPLAVLSGSPMASETLVRCSTPWAVFLTNTCR